jgi:phosphate transport system substrate-binding protein
MITRQFSVITMGIFLLVLHFTHAVAQDVQSQALRLNGAAIASDIVQKWANSFTQSRPNIRLVVTGSSAGKGFSSLLDNQADIAIATRLISKSEQKTAEDKGLKLADSPVGHAGVAVYTSNRNPINELTLDQLKRIFTGQVENWSQLGGPDAPIRCLTRRMPESGAVVFFWETVLEQEPFGKSVIFTENWSTILKTCATAQDIPIGIGPVPLGANTSGAKILAIKKDDQTPGVLPSDLTLKDQSYPIVLQFHFYWNSMTTDKRVMEFVEYCEKMGLGKN